MRKSRKLLRRLFKITGADKIFCSYLVFFILVAIVIVLVEPDINRLGDSIWYCFVASTTIGFGDIYATTTLGRCITILVSLCGIFVFAMMTGVVVSYYMEYLNNRKEETVSVFLEKLENLENLSKRELKEISDKVKKIR